MDCKEEFCYKKPKEMPTKVLQLLDVWGLKDSLLISDYFERLFDL